MVGSLVYTLIGLKVYSSLLKDLNEIIIIVGNLVRVLISLGVYSNSGNI